MATSGNDKIEATLFSPLCLLRLLGLLLLKTSAFGHPTDRAWTQHECIKTLCSKMTPHSFQWQLLTRPDCWKSSSGISAFGPIEHENKCPPLAHSQHAWTAQKIIYCYGLGFFFISIEPNFIRVSYIVCFMFVHNFMTSLLEIAI